MNDIGFLKTLLVGKLYASDPIDYYGGELQTKERQHEANGLSMFKWLQYHYANGKIRLEGDPVFMVIPIKTNYEVSSADMNEFIESLSYHFLQNAVEKGVSFIALRNYAVRITGAESHMDDQCFEALAEHVPPECTMATFMLDFEGLLSRVQEYEIEMKVGLANRFVANNDDDSQNGDIIYMINEYLNRKD